MNIYEQLITTQRYVAVGDFPHIALRMCKAPGPTSIKVAEFEYIKDLIVAKGLMRGFEIATGFGISALAAGLAFKETGGKLVTMDSYVEEKMASDIAYRSCPKTLYSEAEGFKSTGYLIDTFSLDGYVCPKIGWSPDDVEGVIMEEFPDIHEKHLDFVFIDGGHFFEAIERDLKSILPFIGQGSYVLLHDVFEGVFGAELPKTVRKLLGRDYNVVVPYPIGFNMSLVEL
jgi:predicted O-methyltransferase YrrM